jgi:Domain of unknown function (DUF4136)
MSRIIVLLALAFAVLPVGAQKARVDFDHGCRFSHYKTFGWALSPEEQSSDAFFPNQLMRERIVSFIEEALATKGFKRVESGADLLVSYQFKVTEEPMYTTYGDGWGWGWGSGISTTTTQMIYHGTLVVDMTDAHQKQLVFQGVSTQTISSKPTKNTKKLAKAVEEIFEKYPPQI